MKKTEEREKEKIKQQTNWNAHQNENVDDDVASPCWNQLRTQSKRQWKIKETLTRILKPIWRNVNVLDRWMCAKEMKRKYRKPIQLKNGCFSRHSKNHSVHVHASNVPNFISSLVFFFVLCSGKFGCFFRINIGRCLSYQLLSIEKETTQRT